MAYFIDIAGSQITGDLEALTIIEFAYPTMPNRAFGRFARRTRGNPANWRSSYQAESASGDGTVQADSDAAGGNARKFTFSAVDVEKTCSWTENTNVADRVGEMQVFAVLKDFSATAQQFACSVDLAIGGVPARAGKARDPGFYHLSGAKYEVVYLDRFEIPVSPVPANWSWKFRVHRTTGTDEVWLDKLFLLPADEPMGSIDWTSYSDLSAAAAKTFVFDSQFRKAYYGTVSGGSLAPALFSGGLTLTPGLDTRIIFEHAFDSGWSGGAPTLPAYPATPISSATLTLVPRFKR